MPEGVVLAPEGAEAEPIAFPAPSGYVPPAPLDPYQPRPYHPSGGPTFVGSRALRNEVQARAAEAQQEQNDNATQSGDSEVSSALISQQMLTRTGRLGQMYSRIPESDDGLSNFLGEQAAGSTMEDEEPPPVPAAPVPPTSGGVAPRQGRYV